MRDRHLTLLRRVQRAERIACPPRITAVILWDRGHYVEVWGPKDALDENDLAEIGKPVVHRPDRPPPDPASPSADHESRITNHDPRFTNRGPAD